jgi:hypothetical protein
MTSSGVEVEKDGGAAAGFERGGFWELKRCSEPASPWTISRMRWSFVISASIW